MAAASLKQFISLQEYLVRERIAETRSEYWNGEVVAMAGGSPSHNRIVRNLIRRLGNQLDGAPYEPFASETRVRVPACNAYFYPDVLIVCGEAHYEEAEAEALLNPAVIMEVLSPGTEAADRGRKFDCCRTLPSLQFYVLLEQNAPSIDLFIRQEDGRWRLDPLRGPEATLLIGPAGASLSFAEIYDRVTFALRPDVSSSENVPNG